MVANPNASPYSLLPFWFGRESEDGRLLTNESGDYYFISGQDFSDLISYKLPIDSRCLRDLKSRHFVAGDDINQAIDMIATKYRTRKRFLTSFTSLHMMVITLRCNHRCEYCQVSCEEQDAYKFDMSPDVARRTVEYIFRSPSPVAKIEFQGGEPLINWPAITTTVEYAEQLNKTADKHLEFVICTNLTLADRQKLEYLKEHQVNISTSLDGPRDIHDSNRKLRLGGSSYDTFINNLELAREILGADRVSALMTFSANTLDRVNEVIDEYVRLGFDGMFLRSLNPYGFAAENEKALGYPMDNFVTAYASALDYIIKLNKNGIRFIEYYAALLLSRILTPFSTGFVDLQSPSGAGISGAIYDYNGDVYPADEARMLSRMGDQRFLMGNIFDETYEEIFNGPVLKELVSKSCLETMPGCSSCVYRPFCGADPVRNYLEQKDIVGLRPGSPFCKKHLGIFGVLFSLLKQNDKEVMDVFWSWVTNRSVGEVSLAGC